VADPRINVILGAKDDASKVVKGLRGQFEQFKRQAMTGFGLGAGIGIFNLGTRAIKGLVNAAGDAIDAARAEEANMERLYAALEANIEGWNGNANAIEAYFSEVQRGLAFADTDLRSSMTALVAVTHDVREAMDVQAIAMDLARFKSLDLRTATDLLVRVYAGNFGTLSRYGIIVDKNATKTEALAAIQKQAAGQAEAYGESHQAAARKAEMAWGDVNEAIGMMLAGGAEGWDKFSLDMAEWVQTMLPGRASDDFNRAIDDILDVNPEAKGKALIDHFNDGLREVGIDLAPFTTFKDKFTTQYADMMETAGLSAADVNGALSRIEQAYREAGLEGEASWNAAAAVVVELIHQLEQSAIAGLEAGDGMQEGFEDAGESAEDAAARAEMFAKAADHIADSSFPDIRDAAVEAGKAIRAAFRDQGKSAQALAKEEKRLLALRKRALREGKWEALAKIDARLEEINTDQKARRQNARHYREERAEQRQRQKDLQTLQDEFDVTRKRAAQMLRKAGQKVEVAISTEQANRRLQALADRIDRIRNTYINVPDPSSSGGGAGGGPRRVLRHGGGSVSAGRSYLIGTPGHEEWFTPKGPGTMTPARGGGGGGVFIIDGARLFDVTDRGLGRRFGTTAAGGYYRSS